MTNLMSAMVNRRMSVHIMPRMSLRFPSMISSKKGEFVEYVGQNHERDKEAYLLDRCW